HSIFDKGISRRLCNYFGRNHIVKKVIAVSDAVKLPLTGLWPKTKIMYNAIDENIYHPNARIGPVRKSLNITDEIVISMVGLLVEWKCVDDFIRAAQIVVESYPNTRFLIVGDVLYDEKGKKYKKYLEDLVQESGLEKNVIFTGFRNDVPDIMRELDIFVIASKTPDPCPTSLLQAMASGPAAIATNFGGPAEIIKDNQDGLLYGACDYHELAQKMLYLIENDKQRMKIARNAQEKILNNFNYKDYIVDLKDIIDEVLEGEGIYNSGEYAQKNPTWHEEDAPWKIKKIIKVIDDEFIDAIDEDVQLIDVGCGTGQILKGIYQFLEMKNIKTVAIGFDFSEEIIEKAKQNFPEGDFRCAKFDQTLGKAKDSKQIVLLIDILEHLENPVELLKQVKKTCDYAICHLPLEDNFEVNHRRLKGHFTKTVGHLHFYNKQNAIKLFKDNGFEIKKMIYTCSDVSADYKLKSLPRRLIAQPIRKLFFKISPEFTAKVLGNCSLMVLLKPQK
ncbi:MAG: glycosyltransferase, partial [Candidatus Pacebacteria bacterium]|nr:glycosyltransferase [Candidatus Paceibacterota bacterium]